MPNADDELANFLGPRLLNDSQRGEFVQSIVSDAQGPNSELPITDAPTLATRFGAMLQGIIGDAGGLEHIQSQLGQRQQDQQRNILFQEQQNVSGQNLMSSLLSQDDQQSGLNRTLLSGLITNKRGQENQIAGLLRSIINSTGNEAAINAFGDLLNLDEKQRAALKSGGGDIAEKERAIAASRLIRDQAAQFRLSLSPLDAKLFDSILKRHTQRVRTINPDGSDTESFVFNVSWEAIKAEFEQARGFGGSTPSADEGRAKELTDKF